MLRKIITGCGFLIFSFACAQNDTIPLTLGESIELALTNNLDLKSAGLRARTAEVNFKQTRSNVLPDLNAGVNVGLNNGRSIDPFTNSYIDEQLTYSNAGLNLDATIFNGFRMRNSIQRDRYNLQAFEMETEEARQNLVLNVTLAYLQILNNRDLMELAQVRLEATKKQLERLKTLYEQGEGNPADYTDIQGQLANDKTNVVDAKNAFISSVLELSQLLNVDYPITARELNMLMQLSPYELSPEEVFEDARENLATFKAKQLRIKAAEEDVNVSKALYSPEIYLFARLNTNYSSVARLYTETGTQLSETGGFVTLQNQNIPVFTNETIYSEEAIPYYDQLNNNLNSVVGVGVDIPLFNGFRARNNVALEKIQLEESKVDYEITLLQFRQAIRQAHSDMLAALEQYNILQGQVEAFMESYRVNEIRFNSGVSNMVEYIISKNNLDNSRIRLANAKYNYLLRVKVLDYYRGNR